MGELWPRQENRNLPSFIVIAPKRRTQAARFGRAISFPEAHQGTLVMPGPERSRTSNAGSPRAGCKKLELGVMSRMNERHFAPRADDPLLAARIKSFETAFGMQAEMPEVFDLSRESDATLALYGLERGSTKGFARQCSSRGGSPKEACDSSS